MRVNLLALGKKNGDGLLRQFVRTFDCCHITPSRKSSIIMLLMLSGILLMKTRGPFSTICSQV